jgi:hypothetical protein
MGGCSSCAVSSGIDGSEAGGGSGGSAASSSSSALAANSNADRQAVNVLVGDFLVSVHESLGQYSEGMACEGYGDTVALVS